MYNPGSGDGKLKKNRIFSNHTPLLFFIERDMTDKEKAKAYDEALERAKAMIDDLRKGEDILAVSDLEAMFPELRESEDERIRKELINFILYKAKGVSEEQEHSWVTYLEKQKEQKPTNSEKPKEWSEEDVAMIKRVIERIEAEIQYGDALTMAYGNQEIAWLKSLRPSWKPSKEQMQYLLAVINNPNNAGAESCHLTLGSLYNDLKKLK